MFQDEPATGISGFYLGLLMGKQTREDRPAAGSEKPGDFRSKSDERPGKDVRQYKIITAASPDRAMSRATLMQ